MQIKEQKVVVYAKNKSRVLRKKVEGVLFHTLYFKVIGFSRI